MKRGQDFDGPGCQKSLFPTFVEKVGDIFFDHKPLSFVLPERAPDFFEVTFDRFFPGPQNGLKWSKMVKKDTKKKTKKIEKIFF